MDDASDDGEFEGRSRIDESECEYLDTLAPVFEKDMKPRRSCLKQAPTPGVNDLYEDAGSLEEVKEHESVGWLYGVASVAVFVSASVAVYAARTLPKFLRKQ